MCVVRRIAKKDLYRDCGGSKQVMNALEREQFDMGTYKMAVSR